MMTGTQARQADRADFKPEFKPHFKRDEPVKSLWLGPLAHSGMVLGGAVAQDWLDAIARLRAPAGAAVEALVISGLSMEGACELTAEALRVRQDVAVMVHAPEASDEAVAALIRSGAFDVWRAALADTAEVQSEWERSVGFWRQREAKRRDLAAEPWRLALVGESRAMQAVAEVIRLVGPRRSTVLITGETGTGKEMVARALHGASERRHMPMVAVNCSALPENLLEAELFGHVKGAYTGAIQSRVGRFEQANRGTIFLDEIAEMPLELQAKLLRVLQEREFERLGSSESIKVDVRVIAACNVDLAERVRQGKFREDLYYRINVVPLALPPLRERSGDVALLARHFAEKVCRQEKIPQKRLSPEALAKLESYAWPGNVRQLENAIEMAIALSGERLDLWASDFPLPTVLAPISPHAHVPATAHQLAPPDTGLGEITLPPHGLDYEATLGRIELSLLGQALERSRGNKTLAAEMLRLKRTTLAAKLRALEQQSRAWVS